MTENNKTETFKLIQINMFCYFTQNHNSLIDTKLFIVISIHSTPINNM